MKIIRESARIDSSKYGQYGYGGSNRTIQMDEFVRDSWHISSVEFATKTTVKQRFMSAYQLRIKSLL